MDKKATILEALLELVAEQGIHATPMSTVAKRSQVAIGTIYHYFKDKEAIINALYIKKKIDFQKLISDNLNPEEQAQKQFEQMWEAIYKYYKTNEKIYLFTRQVDTSPIITEETRLEGQKYYREILDYFEQGQKEGLFTPMNTALIADLVHGQITNLIQWEMNMGTNVAPVERQKAMGMAWRGILMNQEPIK